MTTNTNTKNTETTNTKTNTTIRKENTTMTNTNTADRPTVTLVRSYYDDCTHTIETLSALRKTFNTEVLPALEAEGEAEGLTFVGWLEDCKAAGTLTECVSFERAQDLLVSCKRVTDTPAETVATFIESLETQGMDGYSEAVRTIATMVFLESWDGRISRENAEWARDFYIEGVDSSRDFVTDRIHRAHLDQIADAMRTMPTPPADDAEAVEETPAEEAKPFEVQVFDIEGNRLANDLEVVGLGRFATYAEALTDAEESAKILTDLDIAGRVEVIHDECGLVYSVKSSVLPSIVRWVDALNGGDEEKAVATSSSAIAYAEALLNERAVAGCRGEVYVTRGLQELHKGSTPYAYIVNTYDITDGVEGSEGFFVYADAYGYASDYVRFAESDGIEARVEILNGGEIVYLSETTIAPTEEDDEETAPPTPAVFRVGIYNEEMALDAVSEYATAEEAVEAADSLIETACSEGDDAIVVAVANANEETIYQVAVEECYLVDDVTECDTLSDALDMFAELIEDDDDAFDEMLDEVYGDIEVCGYTYCAGEVFSKVDPIAYRCARTDWADSERSDMECEVERADIGEECYRYGVSITRKLRPVVQVAFAPAHSVRFCFNEDGSAIIEAGQFIAKDAALAEAHSILDDSAALGQFVRVTVIAPDGEVIFCDEFKPAAEEAPEKILEGDLPFAVHAYDTDDQPLNDVLPFCGDYRFATKAEAYADAEDRARVMQEAGIFGEVTISERHIVFDRVKVESTMVFTIYDDGEALAVNVTADEAVKAITEHLKADTSDAYDVYLDEDLGLASVFYFGLTFAASEILRTMSPETYIEKKAVWAQTLAEDIRDNTLDLMEVGEFQDAYGFKISATCGARVVRG